MAKIYLSNAFSFNMVSDHHIGSLFFRDMDLKEVKELLSGDFINSLGHADIASVVSSQVGLKLEANRINTKLEVGDKLILAQYIGPRLQEGVISRPKGARIKWILVVLEEK